MIDAYFGKQFRGLTPEKFMLAGRGAVQQFVALSQIFEASRFDFACEIVANQAYVFLHYAFWAAADFTADGISVEQRARVVSKIAQWWGESLSATPLPSMNGAVAS